MQLINLRGADDSLIQQAAAILMQAFSDNWPEAWPTHDDALAEVRGMTKRGKICRAAVDTQGQVVGWIGGQPMYDGHVWELHPLAVRLDRQQQGVGRALVEDLERQVAARGGLTIFLGTDDEMNMTSLGGADLYPDVLSHLQRIRNLKQHPFTFYQKLGFSIVGVMPDANGFGKPDIYMAKRVSQR
jgi:aminoglycoside 6'-N-acetyltransferase I